MLFIRRRVILFGKITQTQTFSRGRRANVYNFWHSEAYTMLNSIKYLGVICNLTYYFELSVSTKSKLALHMSIEYSATDYFMLLRQNE